MDPIAVRILNVNRTMAIATVRPDGWPQVTVVGYANRGFDIIFSIFRESQKFANIAHDDRVAIAVAPEEEDFAKVQAVYAGGHVEELTDDSDRQAAWKLMMERHPILAGSQIPGFEQATFMKLRCRFVSVLDYSQGLGHREEFEVGDDGTLSPVPRPS
jgi:nitroimidazol reductase NimA-like FMN-containing flavoprotein (pyridoxamine 5'-phosphate oxidase superfamily)